jgi:hypothetical protein
VADSGLPWTMMRAAQFHDFVLNVVQTMAKLPVMPVPAGVRFQPIPIPLPGKAGRAYRAGQNLTFAGATVGQRTWEDFQIIGIDSVRNWTAFTVVNLGVVVLKLMGAVALATVQTWGPLVAAGPGDRGRLGRLACSRFMPSQGSCPLSRPVT